LFVFFYAAIDSRPSTLSIISFSCFYLTLNIEESSAVSLLAIAKFANNGFTFLFTQKSASYAFKN